MAPYWRFAYEKTWDKNSLMFGTYRDVCGAKDGCRRYGGGIFGS